MVKSIQFPSATSQTTSILIPVTALGTAYWRHVLGHNIERSEVITLYTKSTDTVLWVGGNVLWHFLSAIFFTHYHSYTGLFFFLNINVIWYTGEINVWYGIVYEWSPLSWFVYLFYFPVLIFNKWQFHPSTCILVFGWLFG